MTLKDEVVTCVWAKAKGAARAAMRVKGAFMKGKIALCMSIDVPGGESHGSSTSTTPPLTMKFITSPALASKRVTFSAGTM